MYCHSYIHRNKFAFHPDFGNLYVQGVVVLDALGILVGHLEQLLQKQYVSVLALQELLNEQGLVCLVPLVLHMLLAALHVQLVVLVPQLLLDE